MTLKEDPSIVRAAKIVERDDTGGDVTFEQELCASSLKNEVKILMSIEHPVLDFIYIFCGPGVLFRSS